MNYRTTLKLMLNIDGWQHTQNSVVGRHNTGTPDIFVCTYGIGQDGDEILLRIQQNPYQYHVRQFMERYVRTVIGKKESLIPGSFY